MQRQTNASLCVWAALAFSTSRKANTSKYDRNRKQTSAKLIFIHEQPAVLPEDRKRKWQDDREARAIFEHAFAKAGGHPALPCHAVSDAAAVTIGANRLILGAPGRGALARLLRGNLVRSVAEALPVDIGLVVYA